MSNDRYRIAVLSIVAAVIAAFATTPGSFDRFKYSIGNYDRQGEDREIRETLKFFNATVAGFFVTGGVIRGLNIFPAEQLVKRRIFQDLRYLEGRGMVLAYDRDRSDVRQVLLYDRNHAMALADESWFMAYQDAATRRPISDKKANMLTVRYLLVKKGGKWGVLDYDVYGRMDSIPPVNPMRLLE